jgi:hypothetical protein
VKQNQKSGGIFMAKRKHYRVAKKESQQKHADGIFIPNVKPKNMCYILFMAFSLIFFKGLVIGLLISKYSSKNNLNIDRNL